MSDKMPTNIHLDNITKSTTSGRNPGATEHTLVHNNPDYHVIKKSDVDGGALEALEYVLDDWDAINHPHLQGTSNDLKIKLIKAIQFLIAQSDPDTVTIPRKVLDEWLNPYDENGSDLLGSQSHRFKGYQRAINEVLNYKPTTVGEERSDGEGE